MLDNHTNHDIHTIDANALKESTQIYLDGTYQSAKKIVDDKKMYQEWYYKERELFKAANERIEMLEGILKLLIAKEKK